MFVLKVFFYIFHLISFINLIQSQIICLDNSNITCNCNYEKRLVTCIENQASAETFIDWSTFSTTEQIYVAFRFINFTRLTTHTFTSFSSQFSSFREVNFTFINGIDEISENTFEVLNYFTNVLTYIRFYSPRNYQLADYAFSQIKCQELIIDNIQYNDINNSPYQLNLKAFINTTIDEISIINSKEVQLISNQSSTLYWTNVYFNNCSLTNIDLLYDSLSADHLTKLDLSSSGIVHFPSLVKFPYITTLNLRDNYISEIRSNLFTSENLINEIDLSQNPLKRIEPNAFIKLHFLTSLIMDNTHLKSLETVTTDNKVVSFLSPLNQTLRSLVLSHNFLRNIDLLQDFSHLQVLQVEYNLIEKINENTFKNARDLQTLDLSNNLIESIHPWVFNHTRIASLVLSSNPISSLETTITIYDEQSQPKNLTTSFLYSVALTLTELTLAKCTHLSEINWFVFTKLKKLSFLNLSEIPKTNRFWLLEPRDGTLIPGLHK
ncbi:unnamed protein product [Adineta ricciae]|uniref:Uncharacterized protein n=1 Tax=Adineta ricciae TaxID=249248 RepID=A0A815BE79_ADIRI|nr:unnamed protein product [Adineta ricciae]CAF1661993.1 unnamed protein product [Adineta ricciae]